MEDFKKIENVMNELSSTKKEIISIKVKQVESLGVTDSKFGGCPYIPKSVGKLPYGNDKNILTLLAQFNLEELPKGVFPIEKGILQFFIDCEDDCYGMDFDDITSGEGHKVIYYENIEEYMTEEEIQAIYDKLEEDDEICNDDDYKPFSTGYNMALEFEVAEQIISLADYRFEDLFIGKWKELYPEEEINEFFDLLYSKDELKEWKELADDFIDKYDGIGHRLLGYAGFTQNDPRNYKDELKEYELLFQMDSDYSGNDNEYEICWGDVGIGNFMIKDEDLKNKDFSKVAYNWDCG